MGGVCGGGCDAEIRIPQRNTLLLGWPHWSISSAQLFLPPVVFLNLRRQQSQFHLPVKLATRVYKFMFSLPNISGAPSSISASCHHRPHSLTWWWPSTVNGVNSLPHQPSRCASLSVHWYQHVKNILSLLFSAPLPLCSIPTYKVFVVCFCCFFLISITQCLLKAVTLGVLQRWPTNAWLPAFAEANRDDKWVQKNVSNQLLGSLYESVAGTLVMWTVPDSLRDDFSWPVGLFHPIRCFSSMIENKTEQLLPFQLWNLPKCPDRRWWHFIQIQAISLPPSRWHNFIYMTLSCYGNATFQG